MVLNVHRSHEASRDGEKGEGGKGLEEVGGGGGEREIIYRPIFTLSRHYRNDSCIKMGSDESHFNVSLIVREPQPF